jgi:hypothetical protein
MNTEKNGYTDKTCYKITKDILSVFLIPASIALMSIFISRSIAKTDRRIAITEIVVDKVGGDQLDRDLALEMVSLVDDDYSKQLKQIINVQVIKRYIKDFSSGDVTIRVNAVGNLLELHKLYPDTVINEMFKIIEDDPKNMEWSKIISMTSTLYYLGSWDGTYYQKEKLESLKSNIFYNDTNTNVKKYLDGALSKMKIK